MTRTRIEPCHAYKLLNPGSVTLISVGDGERDNVFSVTWNMPVSKDPGMVAILSGKSHYSYDFINRTGEFAVNIPDVSLTDAVLGCGRTTGSLVPDKFTRFGLTREEATTIRAPLVAEAIASLECQVEQQVDLGQSSLIIAKVLEARANPIHFSEGDWLFGSNLRLLHHLGGDRFSVSSSEVRGRTSVILNPSPEN